MAIEDIYDWNSRISMCSCCEMPEHSLPRIEYEHKDVTRSAPGWILSSFRSFFGQLLAPGFLWPQPDSEIIHSTVSRSTSDTNPNVAPTFWSLTTPHTATYNGIGYPSPSTETNPENGAAGTWTAVDSYANGSYSGSHTYDETDENGVDHTYTATVTLVFSDPVTFAHMKIVCEDLLAEMNWTPSSGNDYWKEYAYFKESSRTYYDVEQSKTLPTGTPGSVRLIAVRYKVGVPANYTASTYFKVEWDEVFFPEDTESPSPLVAARSWEWNGTDEFSDWFEIPTPATAGEVHIHNLRATSYRSPWGTKPRYTGDRWQAAPSG
jgi:hypothetical protein